jgi:HK97 family phage prohead protease
MKKFLQISHKSLSDFGVIDYKSLWKKAQDEGYAGLVTTLVVDMKKSESEQKTFHAIFSSAKEDRHWDVVQQDFDLKYFKKNPVFLDSHNYDSIEHIIGRVKRISVEEGKLQGDIEFMTDNPKGDLAYKMAEQGFLQATSIGFIPKEFSDKGEILKSELLEISAVSVPANPEATFQEKKVDTTDTVIEVKTVDNFVDKGTTVEEVKSIVDMQAEIAKAVAKMVTQQKTVLHSIAKAVQEITEENKMSKKREIHKAIRETLKNL